MEHCLTTLQATDRLVCHLVEEIKTFSATRRGFIKRVSNQ